jgi:hypothetical protein
VESQILQGNTSVKNYIVNLCYAVAGQVHLQLTVSVYCFVKFVEQTVRMGEEP